MRQFCIEIAEGGGESILGSSPSFCQSRSPSLRSLGKETEDLRQSVIDIQKTVCRPYCACVGNLPQKHFSKVFWNSIFTILFVTSVENISLFHSVLDEALERLGKKNLKLKECQYEAVKAVVVDRKDTICILPTGYGKSLLYQLLLYCGLLNLFICNACALRATYSFLYVDHGLSQGLRFLLKGSQARGTRLSFCVVEGIEK